MYILHTIISELAHAQERTSPIVLTSPMQPVVCTFAASAYSSPYVLTHVIRGLHTVRVSYNVVLESW